MTTEAISGKLMKEHLFPAISITMPVHPQFPGIKEDTENIKGILKRAEALLHAKYGDVLTQRMLQRLDSIFKNLPTHHLKKSLLIYLSPETEKVFSMPFPVEQKVIVDQTFEIRDLLYAAQQDQRFLVVSLSKNGIKTFILDLFHLAPFDLPGMPDNVRDAWNQHSLPGWDYLDTEAFDEKNLRNYLHLADKEIEKMLRQAPYPVVLMGDVKLIGYLREHTRNGKYIIGHIDGNYEHASADMLRKIALPVTSAYLEKKQADMLNKLDEAIGMNHFAAGVEEVWKAASEGRGRLLLVEKDFREEGRITSGDYPVTPVESESNPHDILSDAVDDVMQTVLSNGGEVFFVPDGSLEKFNHIALITRY